MGSNLKLDRPWDEVKEKLKEAKVELTDDDLVYQPGQDDELIGRLSAKLHKSDTEIREWIESVSANKAQAG